MTDTERAVWDALRAPFPPEAYKDVTLGRTFTCIDAYHIIERLTEVFGLCGVGWGVRVDEWVVVGTNVGADGVLWYTMPPEAAPREVTATGDATILRENVAEARKKARTNLVSKAASYIGVGLDVYQGKHQDDPYVDRAQQRGRQQTSSNTSAPASAAGAEQPQEGWF